MLILVLYFQVVGRILTILLRVRYRATLAKGRLSDYSYRGKEPLTGFNLSDFLVNASETDIFENNVTTDPRLLQWTMTNIADGVGHEMRESRTDPRPYARIQHALAERSALRRAMETGGPTETIDRTRTAIMRSNEGHGNK